MEVAERAMLADALAEHVPLYLPGHVLHVTTGPPGTVRSAGKRESGGSGRSVVQRHSQGEDHGRGGDMRPPWR